MLSITSWNYKIARNGQPRMQISTRGLSSFVRSTEHHPISAKSCLTILHLATLVFPKLPLFADPIRRISIAWRKKTPCLHACTHSRLYTKPRRGDHGHAPSPLRRGRGRLAADFWWSFRWRGCHVDCALRRRLCHSLLRQVASGRYTRELLPQSGF